MILKDKKVLVTGGAGFIGSHLVDQLIKEGCHVRVIDNLVNGRIENISHLSKNDKFEFFRGSVTDPFDVTQAMKDIDVVFHLACLGVRHSIKHPFESHRVNAEGSLLTLQAASMSKVSKFVHCSSSEVYGTATYVPMPETHPTHPCTVYGAGKLVGEAYARAYHKTYNLDTVIIRPFNTYGERSHHEGDAGEVIPKAIVRALNENPILVFGDGSQTRDFTYVEDTARGLIAAAKCDDVIGHTLNIGSNFEISIKDLSEKILKATGNPVSGIEYVKNRPGDVLRLYADSTEFCKKTGWKPMITFDEGLEKTLQWFRSRPGGYASLLSQEIGINW